MKFLPPSLRIVGRGTDAVVVQGICGGGIVYKVYHPGTIHKRDREWEVYRRLRRHPHFGVCLAAQDNWLALRYEPGPTLYQCLNWGVIIPPQVVEDVFVACSYARSQGLNPRGIHPHNVILQGGRAKVIDVAEFLKPGDDKRWLHTVAYYESFYHLLCGRRMPIWLMETLKGAYKIKQRMRGGLGNSEHR